VVGLRATPSGDDLAKGLEKLQAVHYTLRSQGLVRWTLNDIPEEVQEAYVLMGAALAAQDYGAPADPSWGIAGLRMVQTHVHVPIGGVSSAESF
jgi:hypothetical protein